MSRIGAWASRQGTVIPDMAHLDARVAEFAARYPDEVPRPAVLGRLPAAARRGRVLAGARRTGSTTAIHHVRAGEGWRVERLAP